MVILPFLLLFLKPVAGAIDAGYDGYKAAQVMIDKAAQSWEWGTAAEALLELYNEELSVFGANPFPNGKIPSADPGIFALNYAKPLINPNSEVLVDKAAAGDPASLGVSAILLGQSDGTYLGAAQRQADYLLNKVPRYNNGAISHRPDVAELWADNMAMSFPFLAYWAVQQNDASLMAEVVRQCGLYRDVLKSGDSLLWRHIIGPQSQDTGTWSTGNGWAAYGMVRVVYTLQRWSGSSGMSSQAGQLKNWIKEILDGALASDYNNGLLRNYMNDGSWFGEIAGTAILSAAAYRMAVLDPSMFSQKYIDWADQNRKSLSQHQNAGLFAPAVNPYSWLDRNEFNGGSPEGQAFVVNLYTAYRSCVNNGRCQSSNQPATTISHPGIGPVDILTLLDRAITYSDAPPRPTGCGAPESCDTDGCNGQFNGLVRYPQCTSGYRKGCQCIVTSTVCGPRQSCDLNGCAGGYNGIAKYPQCQGNFVGCDCEPTSNTCGPRQSCDLNGCAGDYNGLATYPKCQGNFVGCDCEATSNTCGPRQSCDLNGCNGGYYGSVKYAQCRGNFIGCECEATQNTCGARQSCDLNGCAGGFNGLTKYPQCQGNFVGCDCQVTRTTCGPRQSCDLNSCQGKFDGSVEYPQCSNNFEGCPCTATSNTCGSPQSCDLNGCEGEFNLSDGKAYCTGNFKGCECAATDNTCGNRQSCDLNHCDGKFLGSTTYAQCTNFFKGCKCNATPSTCGSPQSCDLNGCNGEFNLYDGKAYCTGNFVGCQCQATSGTCGVQQSCDLNNCQGTFSGLVTTPTCSNFFKGCNCKATGNTCGNKQSCDLNGCAGGYDTKGVARCQGNFEGCECNASSNTCGAIQNCDLNGCNGGFNGGQTAKCQGNFKGCACRPVSSTCGTPQSCSLNGCNGAFNDQGNVVCMGNFKGCPCRPDPIWIPHTYTLLPYPQTTPSASPTQAPPQPSPTSHPSVCPDDWMAVGYAQSCGITTSCGGNWGAIFFNGCNNLHLGADGDFCAGNWVKGWGVDCDSSGAPSKVTTTKGNFGNCFPLARNCGDTVGVGSSYNYEQYCCSPI